MEHQTTPQRGGGEAPAPKYKPVTFEPKKTAKQNWLTGFLADRRRLIIIGGVLLAIGVIALIFKLTAPGTPSTTLAPRLADETSTNSESDSNKEAAASKAKKITVTPTPTPTIAAPSPSPTLALKAANTDACFGRQLFSNKIIGLSFCYPKSWGVATVGNVPASASDAGGAYEITFSEYSGLTIDSATSDWKNTVARDGRCADPQGSGPQFSTYHPDWMTEGSGASMTSALRVNIKKEPNYLVRELVDDYYGGVCYMAIVATPGGAYANQVVNLLRAFSGGVTTVKAHVDSPETLITSDERTDFLTLVESMKHLD